MIVINSVMKQAEIQAALEAKGYKFTKKEGFKLYFETPVGEGPAEAKAILKATPAIAGIFFNVEAAK